MKNTKKLKFIIAAIVFLLIILACNQVNAGTLHTAFEVAAFLNDGGGQVEVQGTKIILKHDVTLTEDFYVYDADKNPITIDLNGHIIDFNFSSAPGVAAIWANTAGDLTIIDSTKSGNSFIRTNKDNLISWNTSTLTIENVNLVGMYSSSEPVINSSSVNTTYLKDLTISSYKAGIVTQQHVDYYLDNVTFNLGDSGCEYGIKVSGYSKAELKNCHYKSSVGAGKVVWVASDKASAIIDGGTYEYSGSSSNYLILNENGTLEIKGGTFKHQEGTVVRTLDGTTTISGGEFNGKERTITTGGEVTLQLKGGYFIARSPSNNGAAIGFHMSKTMDDIIANGYFASNMETTTNSGFRLTASELSVYAKPDVATLDVTEYTYNGTVQTPTVTVKDTNGVVLQYDTDYDVQWDNGRINAGEYEAKVVFRSDSIYKNMPSQSLKYKINKATYDMSNVKFENLTVGYTGKAQSIIATGLPEGVAVAYLENDKTEIGEYVVTAKFIGDLVNYEAIPDRTATLTITQKAIAETTITGISNKTYTGKAITQSVVVKNGDITLKKGTDYTVKYSSNKNVGKAKVTITGIGTYYTGTKTVEFEIKPKGTSLKKLTAGKKQIKTTWKAQKTQTTGYEVQYATDKNFKKDLKKVTISKNKTTSTTTKKLKAKKKYYVRIRTYRKVNGKKIYSTWSKSKYVTTKK